MTDVNELLNGKDLFGEVFQDAPKGPIAERFLVPPFSVLNAREGYWQDRKRKWLAIGIQSEVGRSSNAPGSPGDMHPDTGNGYCHFAGDNPKAIGRGEDLLGGGGNTSKRKYDEKRKRDKVSPGGSPRPAMDYSNKERGDGAGRPIPNESQMQSVGRKADLLGNRMGFTSMERYGGTPRQADGTSIFDPVLCELAYRWFCAPQGQIVDPFCGGSVRGIIATILGMKYWGCDLRPEQVEANIEQGKVITPTNQPTWITGCALEMIPTAPEADFIFSCPPYGDLEVYSENPLDLSAMPFDSFKASYREIIKRSCDKLKQDRFACFVIGDYRDKKTGHYNDFVSLTIDSFRAGGCSLYNEAILVTSVGSLPIRITKQFESGRKMGKTHQNVIVFVKGDWRKAAEYVTGKEVVSETQEIATVESKPDNAPAKKSKPSKKAEKPKPEEVDESKFTGNWWDK